MKRLLDITQLCEALSISKTRYHMMKKPDSKWYDPNLPKPIDIFGDSKIRFYSEDVENYIEMKLQSIAA